MYVCRPPHNRVSPTVKHKKQGSVALNRLMRAGKRSRGKPREIWEKDITDMFCTMATASKAVENRHRFCKDILGSDAPEEDML